MVAAAAAAAAAAVFTPRQFLAIEIAARFSSTLSLLGIFFTLVTYLTYPGFDKPINRLLFYATWGNLFADVATSISRSGIERGSNSALCQFQAFLINTFHAADPYWTLCMAINVYLVFFHRYSTEMLRRLEWRYILACYLPPLLSSIIYVVVRPKQRGRIFGNATTWCWITPKWNPLRMATLYGPVWIACISTVTIYILVGLKIVRERRRLKSFASHNHSGTVVSGTHQSNGTRGYATVSREYSVTVAVDDKLNSTVDSEWQQLNTVSATVPARPRRSRSRSGSSPLLSDQVAMAYMRYACLFCLSMMVTWIPASANRVYGLFQPTKPLFGLNFATALGLPLLGFWNAVIYIAASSTASKALWRDICRFFSTLFHRR